MAVPNLDQVVVDAFQANVRHTSQQKGSKAMMACDNWSQQAETGAWDVLGSGEASAKSRDTASTGNETGRQYERRLAIALPYNDHELIETQDPSLMLSDPKGNLSTSLGYSMGRSMDSRILAAAVGDATVVTRSSSEPSHSSSALPAAQTIGTGAEAMSFDIITEVMEKFNLADVDESIPKYAFIGPRQVRELLNLVEVTSSDYVNREQLQRLGSAGVAPGFFGWTWIMSNQLPEPDTGEKSCVFMCKDAVGWFLPQDILALCERDPSRQYAWRPYVEYTGGAVRIQDEQVVEVHVADATVT